MLDVQGLSKAYGSRQALDTVTLDVAAGEIMALLGRNGAGKTTLVSIVAGLRQRGCGSGRDRWRRRRGRAPARAGEPRSGAPGHRRLPDAVVPRESAALRRPGRPRSQAGALGHRRPRGIARSHRGCSNGVHRSCPAANDAASTPRSPLVGHPALVLLDEPTVGADVQTRSQLLRVVHDLARDGAAVVYSTHYFPEVVGARRVGRDPRTWPRPRARQHQRRHRRAFGRHRRARVRGCGTRPHARLAPRGVVTTSGPRVRINTNDPATVSATILAGLDTDAVNLRGLTVSQPSLETAFLQLTDDACTSSTEALTDVAIQRSHARVVSLIILHRPAMSRHGAPMRPQPADSRCFASRARFFSSRAFFAMPSLSRSCCTSVVTSSSRSSR